MSAPKTQDLKPDGAAFDDFFDSIGKKAEDLSINDKDGQKDPATNGVESAEAREAEEPKVVDEIESLCMNCQANVRSLLVLSIKSTNVL